MSKKFTPEQVQNIIQETRPYLSLDFKTYTDRFTKARFIDSTYGEFWITPASLLYKQDSTHPFRKKEILKERQIWKKAADKNRISVEDVIKKLPVHLSLDETTYKGTSIKCTFIDKEFGPFEARPVMVLKGMAKHPKRQFEGRWSLKKLGFEDLKLKVEQAGATLIEELEGNKLKVKCNQGHIEEVNRNNFLKKKRISKYACNQCGGKEALLFLSQQEVEERYKAFGFKVLSEYKSAKDPLQVECPNGHKFTSSLRKFIANKNKPPCSKCKHEKMQKHSPEKIQEFLNPLNYKLLTEKVSSVEQDIEIMCNKNHVYTTKFRQVFYYGQLCPQCGVSSLEKSVLDFMESLNIKPIIHDRQTIKPFELDIRIDNLAVEMAGLYWHSSLLKDKSYHVKKLKACAANNIRLLTIYQDEWDFKKPIIKSILKHHLNLITKKISARKCQIKEIPFNVSKKFFEENHLMGGTTHKTLGLFYKEELISAMSFQTKKDTIEIVRFCSLLETNVQGAFGKLLNELKLKNPSKITSWVDLRYGTGASYEKLGFKKEKVTLGWKWTNFTKTFNRLHCRANMDERKLSQAEHAKELKLTKIYDCGQALYVLDLK